MDIEAAEHTLNIQLARQSDMFRSSRLREILRGFKDACRLEAQKSLGDALASMAKNMIAGARQRRLTRRSFVFTM